MYVCVPRARLVPMEARRRHWITKDWSSRCYEPPYGAEDLNSGPGARMANALPPQA